MAILWEPYADALSEFHSRHSSDERGVQDGGSAAKGEWESPSGDDPPVYNGPLVNTSLGLLGLNKERLAFCTYALWVGRADFDVTRHALRVVSLLRGVTVLKPLTRYDFLLGVSPQFDAEQVKEAVVAAIDQRPFNRVDHLAGYAHSAGLPAWAVVIGPDDELELVVNDSPEGLTAEIKSLGDLWEVVRRG